MKFEWGSWKDWVSIGRGVTATGIGVAAGSVGGTLLTGNPGVGAFLGGLAGQAIGEGLEIIADDFVERKLSKSENRRVDEVIIHAVVAARFAQEAGRPLRGDGFFSVQPEESSPFEEIAEAVLQKAKSEGQTRKLPFLGHLISEMAHREDVQPDVGFSILNKAGALTYKQFCILSMAGQNRGLPIVNLMGLSHPNNYAWEALRQEFLGLYGTFTEGDQRIYQDLEILNLTNYGRKAFELLGLDGVREADLQELFSELEAFQEGYKLS